MKEVEVKLTPVEIQLIITSLKGSWFPSHQEKIAYDLAVKLNKLLMTT